MNKSTVYAIYITGISMLLYGVFASEEPFVTSGTTLLILSVIFSFFKD